LTQALTASDTTAKIMFLEDNNVRKVNGMENAPAVIAEGKPKLESDAILCRAPAR
jgi:hypothetical protein